MAHSFATGCMSGALGALTSQAQTQYLVDPSNFPLSGRGAKVDQRFERKFRKIDYKIERQQLHREDIRDLTELTVRRMDMYNVIGALLLTFALEWMGENSVTSKTKDEGWPHWFATAFAVNCFASVAYLVFSLWFSIHCSINSSTVGTDLLLHFARLSIPVKTAIAKMKVNFFPKRDAWFQDPDSEGETQDLPSRICNICGVELPNSGPSSRSDISCCEVCGQSREGQIDMAHGTDHPPRKNDSDLDFERHIRLWLKERNKFLAYDAYSRACLVCGVNLMLQALTYNVIANWFDFSSTTVIVVVILAKILSWLVLSIDMENPGMISCRRTVLTFILDGTPPFYAVLLLCIWPPDKDCRQGHGWSTICANLLFVLHGSWTVFLVDELRERRHYKSKNNLCGRGFCIFGSWRTWCSTLWLWWRGDTLAVPRNVGDARGVPRDPYMERIPRAFSAVNYLNFLRPDVDVPLEDGEYPSEVYTFTEAMGIECDDEGVVQKVLYNSPAHKTGISTGDRIVKVDTDRFSKEGLARAQERTGNSTYKITVRYGFDNVPVKVVKRFSKTLALCWFGVGIVHTLRAWYIKPDYWEGCDAPQPGGKTNSTNVTLRAPHPGVRRLNVAWPEPHSMFEVDSLLCSSSTLIFQSEFSSYAARRLLPTGLSAVTDCGNEATASALLCNEWECSVLLASSSERLMIAPIDLYSRDSEGPCSMLISDHVAKFAAIPALISWQHIAADWDVSCKGAASCNVGWLAGWDGSRVIISMLWHDGSTGLWNAKPRYKIRPGMGHCLAGYTVCGDWKPTPYDDIKALQLMSGGQVLVVLRVNGVVDFWSLHRSVLLTRWHLGHEYTAICNQGTEFVVSRYSEDGAILEVVVWPQELFDEQDIFMIGVTNQSSASLKLNLRGANALNGHSAEV